MRVQNSAALARSAELRRRRSLCLLATRIGFAALGILAVIAIVNYSQGDALSDWFTVGFVSLLALLGIVVAVLQQRLAPPAATIPTRAGTWAAFRRLLACAGIAELICMQATAREASSPMADQRILRRPP